MAKRRDHTAAASPADVANVLRPPAECQSSRSSDIPGSIHENILVQEGGTSANSGLLGLFLNNFKKTRDPSADTNPCASIEQASQDKSWNLPKTTEIVKVDELKETDTVVAVMGPTGSGKSAFISRVAGVDIGIGDSLVSCTAEVNAIRVRVPDDDLEIVLVDTPGFDDTNRSDYQILELISDWLKKTGDKKVLLDGILYLHNIFNNRLAGTPLKNLKVFEKLCGPKACSCVVMVTTMWDKLDDEKVGERRLEELQRSFWKPMIKRGSKTECCSNDSESPWRILEPFLRNQRQRLALPSPQKGVSGHGEKVAVRLQHETVQQKKALPRTDAGYGLHQNLSKADKERKAFMRLLEKQMNEPGTCEEYVDLLRKQYNELEEQHEAASGDQRRLELSTLERLRKSLSMKTRSFVI